MSTVLALLLQATALDSVRDGRRGHQLHGGLLAKVRDLTEPKQPVKVKVEVTFDKEKGASPSADEPGPEPGPAVPEPSPEAVPEAQEAPGTFLKGALHRAILHRRKKKIAAIVEDKFNDSSTEKLVPYVDHQSAEASLDDATPTVTPETWRTCLDNVVGTCETRYIGSECIDTVVAKLQGYIEKATASADSEVQDFPIHIGNATQGHNIIARVPGEDPNTLVIVGAHYDSIPSQGPAQGAEDNGSGVATVLAVAEALKKTPGCCKATVEFIMFSGEEEGLLGSSAFVHKFMAQKVDQDHPKQTVHGAIIMDEVAYSRPERNGARHLIFETSGHSKGVERVIDTVAHATKVTNAQNEKDPDVLFEINYDGFASDHMSLLNQGIPTVLVIDRDNMYYASKYGHTSSDTVANINNGLGAAVATIVAQAAANLAGAKS